MQQIMLQCFLAAKHKLDRKLGYFDLIGCDFLIDENFKVRMQYRQTLSMILARCLMPAVWHCWHRLRCWESNRTFSQSAMKRRIRFLSPVPASGHGTCIACTCTAQRNPGINSSGWEGKCLLQLKLFCAESSQGSRVRSEEYENL